MEWTAGAGALGASRAPRDQREVLVVCPLEPGQPRLTVRPALPARRPQSDATMSEGVDDHGKDARLPL